MKLIKVAGLRPRETVGLVSPAGPVEKEQVAEGLRLLEQCGFTYQFGKHAFQDHGMVSAPVEQRLEDLAGFWADDRIKMIWALRGGYGTIQLLPRLDFGLLRKNPKLLIGFSDLTALEWAIFQQTGLPSLSGLTLTLQVKEANPYLGMSLEILSGRRRRLSAEDELLRGVQVYRHGDAEGILIGGTLSMICSLCGTPYWLTNRELILYLEDVNEPLYRLDRYIQQLSLTGLWKRVRGVILGQFLSEESALEAVSLVEPHLASEVPIVCNFPYGHLTPSLALPVGVPARLRTAPFEVSWSSFLV